MSSLNFTSSTTRLTTFISAKIVTVFTETSQQLPARNVLSSSFGSS